MEYFQDETYLSGKQTQGVSGEVSDPILTKVQISSQLHNQASLSSSSVEDQYKIRRIVIFQNPESEQPYTVDPSCHEDQKECVNQNCPLIEINSQNSSQDPQKGATSLINAKKLENLQQNHLNPQINNLLTKLSIPYTRQNLLKYNQIMQKTEELTKEFSFFRKLDCFYALDFSKNCEQFPISNLFFKEMKKWNKQLIYEMSLGPHLTHKTLTKIFGFEWPNLKRVVFFRNSQQNQPLNLIQENQKNFDFLSNFKLNQKLQFIAIIGNSLPTQLASSLFVQKFSVLQYLVIDYDILISKEVFETLLSMKPFNFGQAQMNILINQKQQEQKDKLINEYFEAFCQQIDTIRFLKRDNEAQKYHYVEEIDQLNFDCESENEQEIILPVTNQTERKQRCQASELKEKSIVETKNSLCQQNSEVKSSQMEQHKIMRKLETEPKNQHRPTFIHQNQLQIKLNQQEERNRAALQDLIQTLKNLSFENRQLIINELQKVQLFEQPKSLSPSITIPANFESQKLLQTIKSPRKFTDFTHPTEIKYSSNLQENMKQLVKKDDCLDSRKFMDKSEKQSENMVEKQQINPEFSKENQLSMDEIDTDKDLKLNEIDKIERLFIILSASMSNESIARVHDSQVSLQNFSKTLNPFVQEPQSGLFYLDLVSSKNISRTMGATYKNDLIKLNKFLLYRIQIGQQIKPKALQQYFQVEWQSLHQLTLNRLWGGEDYLQHGLEFITNKANQKNLKTIVLEGNYMSPIMIQSFKTIELVSLRKLELSFDTEPDSKMIFDIFQLTSHYNTRFRINILTRKKSKDEFDLFLIEKYGKRISLIERPAEQKEEQKIEVIQKSEEAKESERVQHAEGNNSELETIRKEYQELKSQLKELNSLLGKMAANKQALVPTLEKKQSLRGEEKSRMISCERARWGEQVQMGNNFSGMQITMTHTLVQGNVVQGHNGNNIQYVTHQKTFQQTYHKNITIQRVQEDSDEQDDRPFWNNYHYNNYRNRNYYKRNNYYNNNYDYQPYYRRKNFYNNYRHFYRDW